MRPILLALPVFVAFGQNAAPPAFEAASVKAAAPLQGGAMMFGSGSMSGGPGSTDPGRIAYNNIMATMPPVYVLSVGKGGPKVEEVDPAVVAAAVPASPPPPPGGPGKSIPGGVARVMIGMNTNWVDRPVLDQTDLKGTYEFDLFWTPDENDRVAGQISMAMAAAGHTPPPPGEAASGASDPGLSLAQALQTNYGEGPDRELSNRRLVCRLKQ
jgi:hypothetical protein